MTENDVSYIDYETLLSPSFSPYAFANTIVLETNNPTDVPLDLSTPLSKVLFDTQEINASIDALTSKFSLPLLKYTQEQTASSSRIAQAADLHIGNLNEGYKRLEKEVLERYETADEIHKVCIRLWETARLGRSVVRCLQWGRQLEIQLAEISRTGTPATKLDPREDHVALVRCSNTILNLHELLSRREKGQEGHDLDRVQVIQALKSLILDPAEKFVLSKSEQIVREFFPKNMSTSIISSRASTAYTHIGDIRARTMSALTSLYLLSLASSLRKKYQKWEPEYLISALQEYLSSTLTSSLTSLSRGLTTLPSLDKVLIEISARCQDLVTLESILLELTPPSNPNLILDVTQPPNFLQSLLSHLEINSLPSWFWRSLAAGLNSKVMDLVNKGSASLRILRNNRNSVKEAIRQCVIRGIQVPGESNSALEVKWEREIAVMLGSITGPLEKGG
ncbi:Conserved oligomeric Golgi complex subunit 5 [Golovinomyces cichoracearum]|uniref:Conserved oligomeric Golgi complex subunit 5 n=1 Tax=Golovinomyces cichoracearum TaxID=62708 RepID=A0A420IJU7_9PEZI|nr:Conserved oligomeric Golgi complex subunit 5 [Golovinomyces cichoracearum]